MPLMNEEFRSSERRWKPLLSSRSPGGALSKSTFMCYQKWRLALWRNRIEALLLNLHGSNRQWCKILVVNSSTQNIHTVDERKVSLRWWGGGGLSCTEGVMEVATLGKKQLLWRFSLTAGGQTGRVLDGGGFWQCWPFFASWVRRAFFPQLGVLIEIAGDLFCLLWVRAEEGLLSSFSEGPRWTSM